MGEHLVRIATFTRRELVATLRRPRILLILVAGPFLVLFVFGLGYSRELPELATIVVGDQDSPLTEQVNEFVNEAEISGIRHVDTVHDRDAALADLRAGAADLVVVLPDVRPDDVGVAERSTIEVHHRSLDPVTASQVSIAAQMAVHEVNDQIVRDVIEQLQTETVALQDELDQVRERIEEARNTVARDEVVSAQAAAASLVAPMSRLADRIAEASGLLQRLDLPWLGQAEELLREGSTQLATLSDLDLQTQVEEAGSIVTMVDDAITRLDGVDADVLVRPFETEVSTLTPVRITLDRFYAPGLVALMLQHVAITFAALGVVRERRRGTTELFHVAPVTTAERLTGKSIAHLLLGGLVAAGLTVLTTTVFAVPVPAGWIPFAGLVVLTLLASLGYGYVIAALSSDDSQAVQYSMLMLLASIFLSGLFMPLDRIDVPVRWVSWLLPSTHAFHGFQHLMLLGQAIPGFVWLGLGAIAVVLLAAAGPLLGRRSASAA